MGAAAFDAVGINGSGQGRVHGWMTQGLKGSVRAETNDRRYQIPSLENRGRMAHNERRTARG